MAYRTRMWVTVVSLISSVVIVGAAAAGIPCREEISEKLKALDITETQVKETSVIRETASQGPLQGYNVWIRLKSCTGYLVIDFTDACYFVQAHTRGNCKIPGVLRD